jgi:hypothetical protein
MRHASIAPLLATCLVGLLASAARAEKPAVPQEALGYVGIVEGVVKEKAPQNGWIVLTVSKAQPDRKSKVKDASVLVGKDIPVSARLAGDTPFPEQKAYIESIHVGDKIALAVFYNDHAGNVAIRLKEVPGAASQAMSVTKGAAKNKDKEASSGPKEPSMAGKLPIPAEAVGYVGSLEGAVKEKAPQNGWIVLTVSKAEADPKSKVKDGSVLVGKEIRISARLAGDTPFPEQKAYITSLSVGEKLAIKVFYNDNAGNVAIRLKEVPGAASQAAAPIKSAAKTASQSKGKKAANGAAGGKPPVPQEAIGYVGSLDGTVTKKAPQGAWIVLLVSNAQPDAKSTVKDGSVLVGKALPISARLSGNEPFPEQKAYISSLSVGDKLAIKVFYNDNAGNIALRLAEVPDRAAVQGAAVQGADKKSAAENQPSSITFPTQVQLGNIFTLGEKVEIEANAKTGGSVQWTVSDFAGQKVDSGMAMVTDGRLRIAPHAVGTGYYLVDLAWKDGAQVNTQQVQGQAQSQAQTSYAVIAPVDAAEMADTPFGVVTHFSKGWNTEVLPLLTRLGVAHVRDDIPWSQVEKEKGEYDFGKADAWMTELKKAGVTPLLVMAFGNKSYDVQPNVPNYQAAPYTADGYAGYANYCVATLKHYGTQIQAAEIWNEYNGSFCGGKAASDRPKYYTEMLEAVGAQIKAARSDVAVVGGALVKIPLPYSEKLFQHGALKSMDGIAVHPYQPTPEGVDKQVANLSELMKRHNDGKAKSVWVTEFSTWDDHSVERAQAAAYLVRMYTLLLTRPEVQRVYWYLLRDFAEFKNEGLVHSDTDPMGKYTPVATYPAYANLIRQLHHARYVGPQPADARTRVYQFATQQKRVWVCWSTFGTATMAFQASGPVRLVDLVGGEKQLTPSGGQIDVTFGDLPMYVVADAGLVTTVSEVPRRDRVLADSVRDFSGQQDRGHWSYGYYASNQDGSAPYAPDQVQPMTWKPSPGDWEDRWFGPTEWFCVGEGHVSPAVINKGQGWAVRRWTSDYRGAVRIVGSANRGKNGDGVTCKIFIDGKEIYGTFLPPKSTEQIDLMGTVQQGSRVDFVVTPGPALDSSFDSTGFRATILTEQDSGRSP